MKQVYFDNAATTPMRKEVIERMTQVMINNYGNASSTHSFGRSSKSLLEQSRKTIAKLLNANPSEIVFTSGGTEADNLALRSAVRDLDVKRIITSRIEHHAVLHTAEQLEKEYGITVEYVNLTKGGVIDYQNLELLLNNPVKSLVSLMHVNNEVGNLLDLKRVADLCKTYNTLFHSDTVQSVGHFKIDVQDIPIDFMAVSAHKFHGPKGVGFAYIRRDSGLKPLIFGGEQERGYRAGTESIHNIAGLETALKLAYEHLEEDKQKVLELKTYFINQLEENIQGITFNGCCADTVSSTYTVINACLPIPPEKAQILDFQLDLKGIACSRGSACQSGSSTGSHVLATILSEEDLKKPSVRFSLSHFNTKEEVDYVIDVLTSFLE
ncbi:cysteine desulfurase family protein [Mangrovimonas aestuarii]|uniref:cysteine desulfurase family protein n=1 Tax=Mangrovimonas aestuarii TaxID=3018443 RepID=UPI002378665F|nr:cysteine desulfurase family protein [Mangrovimonas aestuarii]